MSPQHEHPTHKLRIAITGSSGFIGHALVDKWRLGGHDVVRLLRATGGSQDVVWSPHAIAAPDPRLEGLDAVVHLAGAGIADRRWTASRREVLRSSRVEATKHLAASLAQLDRPPKVLVQASATGWYGDRGDEWLSESAPRGHGFLSELCADWEQASILLDERGTRRVQLRIGMVIGPEGGALARLLPIFRLGLGGRLGHGRQWMSWIARHDLLAVISTAITNSALAGPVNAVSPNPLTNRAFTKSLASACRRPATFPAPKSLLRLALGEMAPALLLTSQRCRPDALAAVGHKFRHTNVDSALSAALSYQ
jgi:uncharacterized protein (TIGR01777 family)